MPYSVACECRKVHAVHTGEAGLSLPCSCGRNVEVPSLSILRREAGEFSASPELIIESMLHHNELPDDDLCVGCHANTDNLSLFSVVCERTEMKKELSGCAYLACFLLGGWTFTLLAALARGDNERPVGRNIRYRLPLRLCPVCDTNRNQGNAKELLCQVPVYAHLFKKYPHAKISAC